VTSGEEFLGVVGPFSVDVPWWAEVEPVVQRLGQDLGVPVLVLRLLSVDGGEGGRDGHVTYHVEALERPGRELQAQLPVSAGELNDHEALRAPWARVEGLRELLDWSTRTLTAAGRPVTGPVEQRRTWNLAGLFRLPTARGPVWLKSTPHFAADEAEAIAAFARVDPGLVPRVLGSAGRRLLMEHVPGEDCWNASHQTVTSGVRRFVAAQAALAARPDAREGRVPTVRRPGLPDRRTPVLAERVRELLDGPVAGELTTQEAVAARELTERWTVLDECGLPDTVVHGDFHPGNWRSDGGPPVVVDFADAHWGNPVLDGLRLHDFVPEAVRATAARAWIEAWQAHVPGSDPARALAVAEPLAPLAYAVRYQEFLDGIEPSEQIYHWGDPASVIRDAVRRAAAPDPGLASAERRTRRTGDHSRLAAVQPLRQDPPMDSRPLLALPPRLRLEGEGIHLREWSEDDVPALVELYDDPEMARWTPVASPFDTTAARTYLAGAREARVQGHKVQLAITTDGVVPRGEVLLFRNQTDERDVEIAYGVGAAHRGQGLASRAVRLVAEYALRHTGARRVVLCIEEANTASRAVARSAGFTLADAEPVLRTSRGRQIILQTWVRP
jgi:RimJ/RimL family protein N-acetyltransferase